MGKTESWGTEKYRERCNFAPMISSNNQALDLIVTAIKKSGLVNGKDISICLDVAANELFKKNKYSTSN